MNNNNSFVVWFAALLVIGLCIGLFTFGLAVYVDGTKHKVQLGNWR